MAVKKHFHTSGVAAGTTEQTYFAYNNPIAAGCAVELIKEPFVAIPNDIVKSKTICVIGLTTEAERLYDIRRNRLNSLKENEASDYTNLEKIRLEVEKSKKIFKINKWPTIDVTRKSVEETAASIIKIFEIQNKNG